MTKPSVQLILTADEQQALLQLIDLALKHPQGGLNIVINSAVLATKVKDAPVHDDTAKTVEVLAPLT